MATSEVPAEYEMAVALAIGQAVIAAGALEKVLLGEIGRRQLETEAQPTESLTRLLTDLESQPAGRLLAKLRKQGMAADLAERIDGVLTRRNRMVHGMVEDVAVATALVTGDGIEEVLSWIAGIETDCGTLIAELQPLAYESLKKRFGLDVHQAARVLTEVIDLDDIPDPDVRKDLENARALIRLYGMSGRPDS
jgi:hypothetical protein